MSTHPKVWHYDGHGATRHQAGLVSESDGFRLDYGGAPDTLWRWSDLTPSGARGGFPVYAHKEVRGWRIGFLETPSPEIAAKLPRAERYGRVIDRIGLWPATGAFVALSAVAIFIALKTPDALAPLVPPSFEEKLGDAMVGDFGGRICNGPGGQAALDTLVKRIEPDAKGLKVRVVNIGMVNAVALPGGNIFIFNGLLKEAEGPDEIAGVIGHEIGHVRNRDVMQALLRQMGLSVLLGGASANAGGYVNALVSATYSREAEAKADGYAIRALKEGHVSPDGTAGFFTRLAGDERKLGRAKAALGYLSSHPLSESREKAFRASKVAGASYTPVLSPAQWQALTASCKNDPDVSKDSKLLF